ncbi:hypothetical protein TSAR_010465 [Trichomalopsis sarcophagae]|uniref:Uncharacterized protein n=1 Tax=Trichomalopsis sarcophagae TaxID=543379 RepID=A0A232EWY9_9HYME|nr:hypothetical protein TSAR_010465 [Trichomalopsis sarcophagae]
MRYPPHVLRACIQLHVYIRYDIEIRKRITEHPRVSKPPSIRNAMIYARQGLADRYKIVGHDRPDTVVHVASYITKCNNDFQTVHRLTKLVILQVILLAAVFAVAQSAFIITPSGIIPLAHPNNYGYNPVDGLAGLALPTAQVSQVGPTLRQQHYK